MDPTIKAKVDAFNTLYCAHYGLHATPSTPYAIQVWEGKDGTFNMTPADWSHSAKKTDVSKEDMMYNIDLLLDGAIAAAREAEDRQQSALRALRAAIENADFVRNCLG